MRYTLSTVLRPMRQVLPGPMCASRADRLRKTETARRSNAAFGLEGGSSGVQIRALAPSRVQLMR